jgi:manganese/iron transport system permease protein
MFHLFYEPFLQPFMQKAWLAMCFCAMSCSAIGCYLVLRRMVFASEALCHTLVPGMAVAYWQRLPVALGALGAAMLTALGIHTLALRSARVNEDTAIGVTLSGFFALGVALMSLQQATRDLGSMLFGSLIGIEKLHLWCAAAVGLAVAGVLTLLKKELELCSVDPGYAQFVGLRLQRLKLLLLLLTAVSVVVAVRLMGALLTTALMVIPAATARLCCHTLSMMQVAAFVLSLVAGTLGLYLSYFFPLPLGCAVVMVHFVLFLGFWGFQAYKN